MDNVKFELIKVFGPSVFKVTIPENIVKTLNKYIDDIISSKEKSLKLNVGEKLAGDVTQEFKLEKKIMEDSGWTQFLANCTGKWIELETQKKITTFQLINSWIVRQFQNDYNPLHVHGGHISGVGYLKLPSDFGEYTQKTKVNNLNGNLSLVNGTRLFNSPATYNIKPKVGEFYLFPNYLMHVVYPFTNSNEERRSISFNALINDEIYNVYGR